MSLSAETASSSSRPRSEPNLAEPEAQSRQTLVFEDNALAAALYGEREGTLRILEQELGVQAHARGNQVRLLGPDPRVRLARSVLEELYGLLRGGHPLEPSDVRAAIQAVSERPGANLRELYGDVLASVGGRRRINAKNLSQRRYLELMERHDLVIAVGPAGTGKTYLAMAMAIAALNRREVVRVILTRPAVEAGEKLGFLPGDMKEKVDPYLRPLYDALHDCLPAEQVERRIASGEIEIAPLAFMRGRTLADAFIILDEAQNTTIPQMKMFLTRFGMNSRMVICGDPKQVDLPIPATSGLADAVGRLEGLEGINVSYFTSADVVRHPIVGRIVDAYEGPGA